MEPDQYPYETNAGHKLVCHNGECCTPGDHCEPENHATFLKRLFRAPLEEELRDLAPAQLIPDGRHVAPVWEEELRDATLAQGGPELVMPTGETGDNHRKDAGKPSGFFLIPTRPLTELAKLYAIGAKKYSPRGWEDGMAWSRILDPAFRHLLKWMRGEKYDPVDGQHHLIAVAWAMFALVEYEETHPELDDIHPNKDAS